MIESRHNNVFKRILAEHRAELLEALGDGVPFETYNITVGRLRGLAEAEKLADDADHEINGGS